MDSGTLTRTLIGLVIWIGLMVFGGSAAWWSEQESVISFGLLVILPIALNLARIPEETPDHLYQTAIYLQPFAALITGTSYLIPGGVLAGTLAISWAPVSALLALSAIKSVQKRKNNLIEEWSRVLALVLLPFAAFFLWAERMAAAPFGISGQEALSFTTHLLFAGFGVLLINSLVGRLVRTNENRLPPLINIVLILTPAAVAAFFWQPQSVTIAQNLVFVFQAVIYLGLAYLLIREAFPATDKRSAKFFFIFSVASGVFSIGMIIIAGLGSLSKFYQLPTEMLMFTHGWITAIGFIGCALVGFGLIKKQ